jgi:hypothetical protein
LYVDLVLDSISEAARRALQTMKPANYEFQSEFARHYFARGKTEGKAEGKAELLIKLAALKFGPLTEEIQQRIRTATDAELDQMAERFFGASTLDQLLPQRVS